MGEEHEAVFVDLIRQSWKRHGAFSYAQNLDEVLVGAVIAGAVEIGYSLIDLNSDGTNHYLRFEYLETKDRLICKLKHLTGSLERAKVLGHLADVTVGVGRPVSDVQKLWSSFKQELKSGLILQQEPGVITLDADMAAGYIYAQVGLIWDLNDYMKARYQPDTARIASHIGCCRVSLEKYLDGRLQAQA